MTDVFVSYAREDLEQVRPIVGAIEIAGYSVFWDRRIPSGMTWRQYIGKALDEAKCVIVVWSKHSVESKFVQEEADDGNEREILIPILIDDARVPLGFRSIQHEDFREWDGDSENRRLKSLLKSIEGITGKAPKEKPPIETAKQQSPQILEPTSKEGTQADHKPALKRKTSLFLKLIPIIVSLTFTVLLLAVGLNTWIGNGKKPTGEPDNKTFSLQSFTNSLGMEFVLVSPGSFMMGSEKTAEEAAQRNNWDAEWFEYEDPQHLVEITKPFYFQKTEVTQGQWKKVMGDNPSEHKECGDNCPVENVSWEDTQEFIKKLNTMEGTDTYRLPTEAEWEYAARAGTTTLFSFGDNVRLLGEFAWCDKYTGMELHPVASKKPNPWGIYDLYGSVWEWVEDDWHNNYEGAPTDERAWTDWPRGSQRVMRGGAYGNVAQLCRSASRRHAHTGYKMNQGFRLAKSVAP